MPYIVNEQYKCGSKMDPFVQRLKGIPIIIQCIEYNWERAQHKACNFNTRHGVKGELREQTVRFRSGVDVAKLTGELPLTTCRIRILTSVIDHPRIDSDCVEQSQFAHD
jgi:hypothetical protein